MQEISENNEEPKKTKQKNGIEDRRYWVANFFMFLFLLVVVMLAYVGTILGWPIDKSARITVENKTGKPCYLVLLSTDTDSYGRFGEESRIADTAEYWDAMKDACIAGGMSEEEAGQYVSEKKNELRFKDNTNPDVTLCSFEMYRELIEAYSKRLSARGTEILGRIIREDITDEIIELFPPYEVWKEIAAYQDPDGYRYIHQEARKMYSDKKKFELEEWVLPGQFKFMLYWPEEGRFAVSEAFTRDHIFSEYRVTAETLPDGTVAKAQAVDESRSEKVPWRVFLEALLLCVGCELLVARLCGAREKRQLLSIAVVSTVLHIALFVLMILSGQALMVRGALKLNPFYTCIALWVLLPIVEMPIYARLLREKGKNSFEWFKYYEFTLFINWASAVCAMAVLMVAAAVRNLLIA